MASNDPVITNVVYDGTQVKVTWKASGDSGVTGYVIQLRYIGQADGAVAYASPVFPGQQTTFGTLALPAPLNTDVAYLAIVQAMWGTETGEASAPVVMPTALPVLQEAWYDGSQVYFSWTPSPQSAQGYQLVIYSLDSGLQYTATIADPAACRGIIPASAITQGVDPAQQWVAAVAALGENSTYARSPGANFPKPLPTVAPTVALYQAGTRINARWQPLPASSVTGFRLSVTSPQDDTDLWIDIPGAGAAGGVLPLDAPLAADRSYEFRLIAQTSTGAGVASAASGIIATVPTLTAVSYDGSSVGMSWAALSNPAITGYTLQVISLSSGVSFTSEVSGYFATGGSVPLENALDPAQEWVARLIANGPLAAQTGDTPIPAAIPAINTVQSDGRAVTVEWNPLTPAPGGYLVNLLAGGAVVASSTAAGSSAALAIPAGAGTLTAQVAPRTGIATGAPSAAAIAIAQPPQITSLSTDPVTGKATLAWGAVADATGYVLSFSNGNTASTTDPQYLFATAPQPNAALTATVAAQRVSGGATSTGPASPPAPLATGQPALLRAGFDGVNASAHWTPMPQASGYRVSVQQAGDTPAEVAFFNAPAGADSASFPFTPPDSGQTYVLGVQALFGDTATSSSGPISPRLPLFKAGYFTSAAPLSTAYPYLYPATSLATVSATAPGEAITLYLPQIGGATPLKKLPITQGAFNLQANADSGSSASYPYLLTFAADSAVWTFTSEPVRSALQEDYVAFLKAAEQTAGVVPWGIVLLQQVISRYMPQTFQETLYYAYGLTFPGSGAGSAYADLRPGMVLRVAADGYQAFTESSTLKWSSGYVAGPVVDYDIGGFTDTAGNWTVGYDSFIGQLVAGGALSVPPPPFHAQTQQEGGVADAADLYFPGFRTPFYRLFVPTALATPSAPTPTDTPKSFVLAAAPSYSTLTTTVNTPGGAYPVAYFRGRAVVRACIRVRLDGNEVVVPVGTTVGNLLERAGRLTPPAPAQLQGLRVTRALGPAVPDPAQPLSTAAAYPIRFDWKAQPQYAPGWSALTLPLLPGDSVSTGEK
jgi:hypothetical protein